MARLFILFLIALLPLRGWTAERMVFAVDQGAPATTQPHSVGMSEECALHMQMAAHQAEAAQHGADHSANHGTEHKGCQSCQLCMPLAAMDAPEIVAFTPISQAVPVPRTRAFVSADTARHAKPPIS